MKTKKRVIFAVFTALMLIVTACPQPAGIGSSPVAVTGVTLDKPTVTLALGNTGTLTASILPQNAANKAVTWASDDEDIATVDQNGKVTAVATGEATITVTTADGGHKAESVITVTPVSYSTDVTSVTLNETAVTLAEGDTETLIATVQPNSATNKAVTWSSSNESVATVDQNGEVTAVAAGEATITVTTEDGDHTAASVITVTPIPASIAVTKQPDKIKYGIGEELDINGLEVTLTFSNNTTQSVSVSAEHITGFDSVTTGQKTLTVTYGGKIAQFDVTVLEVSQIEITQEPTKIKYYTGDELDIAGLVVTLTFSDNTTQIANVTIGHITGFDSSTGGTQTLTVTYGGKTATFTVAVIVVSKIEITAPQTKTRYYIGEHLDITGLEVTLTYSDDTTEIVPITTDHIAHFDSATTGSKNLIVHYGGAQASFNVTVFEISKIEITKEPDNIVIPGGSSLNITGLEVTATYTDNVTEVVSVTPADITGFNSATTGIKTLTVSHRGKTATFIVVVAGANTAFIVRNQAEWNSAQSTISGGGNNKAYDIYVVGNAEVAGIASGSTFGTVTGLSVTLLGNGKLYLNSQGSLIRLTTNQTLIIDSANLTLEGLKSGQNGISQNNNAPTVYVTGNNTNGNNTKLELRKGTISGNYSTNFSYGGGVDVRGRATFIMDGGAISGNTVSGSSATAGGVQVSDSGSSFTLSGGIISDNSAGCYGGGVDVRDSAAFTMTGGTISGNRVPSTISNNASGGGGVSVNGGNFTLSGGTISNNTVTSTQTGGYGHGGGVFLHSGSFTVTGGTISGNTANTNGGGVYKYGGTFTIGGTAQINGNNTGGNVYLANNQFITPGSGDNAPANGLNVSVSTATASGIIVQSGATSENVPYFHADQDGKAVILSDVQLVITQILDPITAPVWREGKAVSLVPPTIANSLGQPTAQGWQISNTGSSGWTNFTPPSIADISYNGKYLRYYVTIDGQTYHSNTVIITVISATAPWELTIAMWDYGTNGTGDGWDDNGALRINVNGTDIASNVKVSTTANQNTPSGQRNTNTYTFSVYTDDVVQIYWVAGTAQNENSFIVYYTDTPPNPTFTTSNNNNWSGSNALVYRLRGTGSNTLNNVSGGTLLGSFTVP